MVWAYTFISVIAVSAISLVGLLFLSLDRKRLQKILLFLVSFAVGGLMGGAFIHLIPASFENLGEHLSTSLFIILGILIFFTLEKFIRWRHCHVPTSAQHLHPVATLNLIGDGVHNLLDGILIGASYSVSLPIGVTTTIAVVLHEVPQEIGDFGVLIHGGFSVRKALVFNFITALTAVLGALLALTIGTHIRDFSFAMLPITAGGFIYIAGSDLIPELHHESKLSNSVWQFVSIVLGIGLMALLAFIE